MKKLSCIFGSHDFMLVGVFRVPVTNEARTEILMLAPVAFALACDNCGKRKLHFADSLYADRAKGIRQDALIWLETGYVDAGAPMVPETPEDADLRPIGKSIKLVVDNHG